MNQSLRRASTWLAKLRGGFLCKAGYNALMKYSLRSLMIVAALVTLLVFVLIGARAEYMRQWAVFHERESKNANDLFEAIEHRLKASEYRGAIYRPWQIVFENDS